jgi:crotonobetainyl-CoA:carnitine CoA-transferase CaiB-like acyl-CoA transferase
VGDVRVVANPVKVSGGAAKPDRPPPRLGEHTDAILRDELGLSLSEIQELRGRGVI